MSEEISVVEGNPNDIDLTGVINQEEKDDFIIEDDRFLGFQKENGFAKPNEKSSGKNDDRFLEKSSGKNDDPNESFAESDKVDWEKQSKLNLSKTCKKIKIRRYKKSFPNLFKEYNIDDI